MKATRHYFLITACISLMFMNTKNCVAQDTITLNTCLQQVLAADPVSRSGAITESIAGLRSTINKSQFAPQASLNGKATWQSDVTTIPIEMPGFDIPTPDQDQYTVSLDITQSIYNGGAVSARRTLIDQERVVAQSQNESRMHDTELQAMNLYFQIALQDQLISSAGSYIVQLENSIRILEDNLSAGVLEKKDVLAARIKLHEAIQKRDEAQHAKRSAKSALAVLMGDPNQDFEVIAPDPIATLPVTDFSQRADVLSFSQRIDLLRANDIVNKARYNPKLSAFATLGYGKPGLNFLSNEFDTYAIVGLNASIPLTRFYQRTSSRESEVFRLQADELKLHRESLLRTLLLREAQILGEIQKLNAWLLEDDEIIVMRVEVLDVVTIQLDAGTVTSTDYLNELQELAIAREKRLGHEIQLQHQHALLNHLYGFSAINN